MGLIRIARRYWNSFDEGTVACTMMGMIILSIFGYIIYEGVSGVKDGIAERATLNAEEINDKDYTFLYESRNNFESNSIYYSSAIATQYDDFIVERYKDNKITNQEFNEIKDKLKVLTAVKEDMESATKRIEAKKIFDKLKKESKL